MDRRALWSGRFERGPSNSTLSYTSSLSVDERLAWYDVVGSIAHARMLARQGIIGPKDERLLVSCLKRLIKKIEKGELELCEDLEDVHTNIEVILTKEVGEAGSKIHTARSRNDQVVTDLRMALRDSVLEIVDCIISMETTLLKIAENNLTTVMPGFTHMQHAQPITLAHHLMAHFYKLARDIERFFDAFARINVCPLGSAALAGTTFNIDRKYVSDLLGFYRPCENSIDGVSDRDFVVEYVFAASLTMIHLSSICEELVLWTTPEFAFAEMDDRYSTGSSIMPQKKNPDVAELIRGRTGGTIGNLVSLLVLLKGLPMAYNRDLQEDKSPVLEITDTLVASLEILTEVIKTIRFDSDEMEEKTKNGFLNATDLADYLVTKGVPFRTAHEIVGKIVRYALKNEKRLEDLSMKELQSFYDGFEEDVSEVFPILKCIERRRSYGGTAPEAVKAQVDQGYLVVKRQRGRARNMKGKIDEAWKALL